MGQAQFLSPPDTEGYIDYANWYASGNIIFTSQDPYGAIIEISEYFTGTATVSMSYVERYFNKYTGREGARSGSKSWTITCKPVNIVLGNSSIELKPNETARLTYSWSPSGWASKARVEWSSDNTSVATVENGSSSYVNYATITAKSSGTATITATTNMGYPATCTVTVKAVEPDRVSLPSTATTKVGETVTLKPTLSPSDAETTYTWSSDNSSVASVSSSGVVSGKKTGTANITVKTANGKTATCKVTVEKGNLSLTCNTESGLIAKGTRVILTANHSDADIYYTLDGSMPTSNSNRYSGSIPINESITLKAIAIGSEYHESNTIIRWYEVTGLNAKENFPQNGTSTSNQHIIPFISFNDIICAGKNFNNISLKKEGIDINGRIYIKESCLYYEPKDKVLYNGDYILTIPDHSIQSLNGEPNMEITNKFIVNRTKPVVSTNVDNGLVNKGTLVKLSSDKTGTTIYYTTDGREPSTQSLNYSSPITINQTTTIKAIAVGNNYETSDVLTKTYTVATLEPSALSPSENSKTSNVHIVPHIIFNERIWKGSSFGSISLKKIGSGNINGDVTITDNNLSFVPQSDLSEGDYILCIPSSALTNANSVPNIEKTEYKFSIATIDNNIDTVVTANNSTFFITRNGTLWSFGKNEKGRLGDGTTTDRKEPIKVMTDVKSIVVDNFRVYVIKKDGTLWSWGYETYYPKKVLDDVKEIRTENSRTFAIKNDRSLWQWGTIPVQKTMPGGIKVWADESQPTPIKVADNVIDAAMGLNLSFYVTTDGNLWAWGYNYNGELGTGDTNDRTTPTRVMSGVKHVYHDTSTFTTFALKNDKSLWAWGKNGGWSIGDGTTTQRNSPYKTLTDVEALLHVGTSIIAKRTDGSIYWWGVTSYYGNDNSNIKQPQKLISDIIDFSCTSSSLCYITNNHELWRLHQYYNTSKYMDNAEKVSEGFYHVMAISPDGSLWGYGTDIPTEQSGEKNGQMKLIYKGIKEMLKAKGIATPTEDINLNIGETTIITPKLMPNGADYQSIKFESNNNTVATVSPKGILTAYNKGTASVKVTVDETYSANYIVNVTEDYPIVITECLNGSIEQVSKKANSGQAITLVTNPKSGYQLNSLKVIDKDGNIIKSNIENGTVTFTMPPSDVRVIADFGMIKHSVKIEKNSHGQVKTSKNSYAVGEPVTLTIDAEEDCVMHTLSICDNNGNGINYTTEGDKVTFLMPSTDVKIEATFKDYLHEIIKDSNSESTITIIPEKAGEGETVTLLGDSFFNIKALDANGNNIMCHTSGKTALFMMPAYAVTVTATPVETKIVNPIISITPKDTSLYNLSGQRIAAPRKGINIVGGKKVIIK